MFSPIAVDGAWSSNIGSTCDGCEDVPDAGVRACPVELSPKKSSMVRTNGASFRFNLIPCLCL